MSFVCQHLPMCVWVSVFYMHEQRESMTVFAFNFHVITVVIFHFHIHLLRHIWSTKRETPNVNVDTDPLFDFPIEYIFYCVHCIVLHCILSSSSSSSTNFGCCCVKRKFTRRLLSENDKFSMQKKALKLNPVEWWLIRVQFATTKRADWRSYFSRWKDEVNVVWLRVWNPWFMHLLIQIV